MDFKQPARVHGRRCSLRDERGQTQCAPVFFSFCFVAEFCPEELLIDFRELIGEHSGENMAEELFNTVETYGLEGKVDADETDDDMPELTPV